jgi:L-threonylcarbamoyladenylate synthase
VVRRRADSGISELASAGLDTVAIRMPAHRGARTFLAEAGRPLAAPSANRSGKVSPTTAQHVAGELGDAVALILDGGPCEVGLESTVLDMSGETPALLRPGGVPLERKAEAGEALLGFGPAADATLNLSQTGDLREAAANLFAMLRGLDRPDFTGIAVMPIPQEGLGRAINDRLRRATAPRA